MKGGLSGLEKQGYPLKLTKSEHDFIRVYAAIKNISMNDAIREFIIQGMRGNPQIVQISQKEERGESIDGSF